VTLKTRMEGAESGCEIHVADSKLVSSCETACPVGSNFAVRNLFYNVPGRRKFLKSDNVELKHVISEFTNVALTRPEVAFSLSHNGKDVFVLRKAMSLKFRIPDLRGAGAVNELIDISADIPEVRISGFIGRPDCARKNQPNQFFFVNGRYFRSPYLHKAVMKGYENIVPEGYTPSYFIFLDLDPQKVDVNVSPRKTEVKFEDERVIFQVIQAYVREHLAKNSFSTGIDFDTEGAPNLSQVGRYYYDLHSVTPPDAKVDHSYNPFDEEGGPYGGSASFGGDGYGSVPSWQRPKQNYGKLFEDSVLPSKSIIVLHNKFIVTAVKSGLLVIDIRRARERILYGRFLKAIVANAPHAQTVLFPVQVRVGAENLPLFEENSAVLAASGFDIAPFGKDTVVVNGVPEGYSVEEGKVVEMVSDLVAALSEDSSSVPGTAASVMAERFARIGAAGGSALTSTMEAQRLIDQLFASENADYTPSGRKIMTIIPAEELEKKL
ncbi:MAG: DNA mismatch repair endonuclease MutL, partial [Bacteroidales bacterium]|nr:DNA mismatch repair endonuclease MutL [Bacteroidales bacterium]